MYRLVLVIAAATFAIGVTAQSSRAAAEEKSTATPNVVVVLVDDAGYSDFPHYSDGKPRTPQIDRLAKEGIQFTNFYVNAPLCSPSRAALTTGQFPLQVGITSYIASRQENRRRGIRDWLDPEIDTLPRALHERGYMTGHFGKWHLGGGRDVGEAPLITEYGFDASLTQFEGLGDRVLPLTPAPHGAGFNKLPLGAESEMLGRGSVSWKVRDEVTRAFVGRAVDFIRKAEAADRPFYVNVWPDDVHTPLFPPEALLKADGKRQKYLAVLENMDRQLGELFEYIRSSDKLRDNTLVLVMSDNGPEPGAGVARGLRGFKGQLFEGGVRTPLVVWGPGVLAEGSAGAVNSESVISSVDLVASLLTLAGAVVPSHVDGEDLCDALLGRGVVGRTKPLMWSRPPDRGMERNEDLPDLAIREAQWKLLVEFDGSNPQLYDLSQDAEESDDVAAEHQQIVDRLTAAVLKWRQSVGDFAVPAGATGGE